MTCPRCNVELACPCSNCKKWRAKEGKPEPLTEVWQENGEICECPICGFEAHLDYWEQFAFYQYDIEQETNKLILLRE